MKNSVKLLIIIDIILLTASLLFSIFIGLILPLDWTRNEYVCKRDKTEALKSCNCQPAKAGVGSASACLLSDRRISPMVLELKPQEINHYPYLVSLNIPAYVDDKQERLFACNGVILSHKWILTGYHCLCKANNFKFIRVRAGSAHWNKGGTTHRVENRVIGPKGLSAIGVSPLLTFNEQVQNIVLPMKKMETLSHVVSVGWDIQYLRPVNYIQLHRTYEVDTWGTKPCKKCGKSIIIQSDDACKNLLDGTPLVAHCNMLIGFQCKKTESADNVKFVSIKSFHEWIQSLLNITEKVSSSDRYSNLDVIKMYKRSCCEKIDINECRYDGSTIVEGKNPPISSALLKSSSLSTSMTSTLSSTLFTLSGSTNKST